MTVNESVSIVMPSYNCARFIADSIKSVIAQTHTDWELIIVDDCSTDDTESIVASFCDDRIRYIRNEKNNGAAISRNRALREAKGRWIAFLDSDDLWLPEKLERQIGFMKKNGYSFSYHNYTEISEEGHDLGISVSGKRHVGKFDMYACCWPGCLSVMYDADKLGLIQIRDIRKNNDTAIWLKAIKKSDCHLFPEVLAKYRRRKGSITPPSLKARILWHYKLFRDAELMNPIASVFWMCMNVFGNAFKKMFYVKINKTE